jgi:magnesium transporter
VSARWLDLVDPTREELLGALPGHVDPEIVELGTTPTAGMRAARPVLEGHGAYVFGIAVAALPAPEHDRIEHQEIDFVATQDLLVTVRKASSGGGAPFDPAGLRHAADQGLPVGQLVQRLLDEVADTHVDALDSVYAAIEELEDALDTWEPSRVRERISDLRHELLVERRLVSASRSSVRRIIDDRVELGSSEVFPPDVERQFADTYETLVRATEELDIARELVAGVRDHHQSKIAETQGEVAKTLTVIASLVLVPSLIVGFYGQNFESAFDEDYWSIGVSSGLIVASTILQLALFRWRRWI